MAFGSDANPHNLSLQVVGHGLAWAIGLGMVNVLLVRAARVKPTGFLARKVSGGFFNMAVHAYMVATLGQAFIQPGLWMLAYFGRDPNSAWWFGAQPQWVVGEFLAYSLGYFTQDAVVYLQENSTVILAHHVGCAFGAWLLSRSMSWRGFVITSVQLMELGSLACGLGDLGLLSRRRASAALLVTSAVPLATLPFAFWLSQTPDLAAGIVILLGTVVGALRCQEAMKFASR